MPTGNHDCRRRGCEGSVAGSSHLRASVLLIFSAASLVVKLFAFLAVFSFLAESSPSACDRSFGLGRVMVVIDETISLNYREANQEAPL